MDAEPPPGALRSMMGATEDATMIACHVDTSLLPDGPEAQQQLALGGR